MDQGKVAVAQVRRRKLERSCRHSDVGLAVPNVIGTDFDDDGSGWMSTSIVLSNLLF
jgi:hypothetical protein